MTNGQCVTLKLSLCDNEDANKKKARRIGESVRAMRKNRHTFTTNSSVKIQTRIRDCPEQERKRARASKR